MHYTSGSGDEVEGYTLSLKNVAGREVYNIYTRSATNQIPVSDLAAGSVLCVCGDSRTGTEDGTIYQSTIIIFNQVGLCMEGKPT
ncbi:MAG: hypothetical protein IPM26_04160 [Saprospiraceae bacterium]|nr:hypothetical protein [Saprospiraceae bacterium]